MNLKENMPIVGRGRGRGRSLKVIPVQGALLMGPPKRPAPKRKDSSTSPYTTSNSSRINWKSRQNSLPNISTPSYTVTPTRSHSSSEQESRVVIALSEGRGDAMCEVGIAAVNTTRPSLILCQISDSQSYINTLTKINILNPSEIIIPLTFIDPISSNRLIEKVKEQFPNVKITGVTRSTFNKNTGLQYIKQLCVPSMNSIVLILQHRYYALAAAGALLTYTENMLYVIYAKESIKIEYQESEGSTIIDVATADRLELVASARPMMTQRYSCLLDVLNYCFTKIGVLTLRASILQPPCSVPDIEARLDCVTELKEHSEMLTAIQVILQKLSNVDQLLSLATVLPDQAQSCSERQLNYILLLNSLLEQITPLRDIFENSRQPFFIELRETLGNSSFSEIKEIVRTLIHTDAHPGKGQYGTIQRCFAIKSGINSLLDLVRKSYSERLDDMREYVKTLGEKYNLALSLNNNYKKGYHIVLTLNAHQKKNFKKTDLPPEFIQVERLSNICTMQTPDLIDLAYRVEDINMDILKMSNIMIYKILIQIRTRIGIFYKLCEDIAKLDMLQSLAQASNAMHNVRPKFDNYLEVVQARHPLLNFLCSVEPIANSMYASEDYNINIITGPNGSGKSIFIRQVVLIQVMAQVGCYVPAQSATLRVADRILARIYLEDNMTCGASAFVLEMKEIQYFLTVLTKNTLIIADEPCRSTSVEEGTALAMGICEKLMRTCAFVFFTTHFKLMAKLADLHLNIKTWQLETLTETVNDEMILRFTYNVIPGVTSLEHYGFFLAKGSWHENICKYAEEILSQLSTTQKKTSHQVGQANPAARLKYNLEAELKTLKAKKQLTRTLINEKLLTYQRNLSDLGYQVELSLFSNDTNNNQAIIHQNDNNYDGLQNISNCGSFYNENVLYTAFNNLEANPLNNMENIQDHFATVNDLDLDNLSQNLSQIFAEQIQTENPPTWCSASGANVMEIFNIQNESNDKILNATMTNFEDVHPSVFHENLQFQSQMYNMSGNCSKHLFAIPDNSAPNCTFKNIFESRGMVTTSNEFPTAFSEANNSLQKSFHFSDDADRNNSQDLSYSNIFEPEIILESIEQLESSYSNVQQTAFTFQKEITAEKAYHIQEPIALGSASLVYKNTSLSENDSVSHANNLPSRNVSAVSIESSSTAQKTCVSFLQTSHGHSISDYEDASSQICNVKHEKRLGQSVTTNFLPDIKHHSKTDRKNDSFLSVTELQFSLPLEQNVERTSTPVFSNKYLTEPVINLGNQADINYYCLQSHKKSSTNDSRNSQPLVDSLPNMVQPASKSDSINSDSVKWKAKPTSHEKSTPNGKKCSIINNSSDNTNSKPSTESIIWNINKNVNKNKNINDTLDADVTAAISDLQSCSEHFLDSENWDSIDEEIKLQINKQSSPAKTSTDSKEYSMKSICKLPRTETMPHNKSNSHGQDIKTKHKTDQKHTINIELQNEVDAELQKSIEFGLQLGENTLQKHFIGQISNEPHSINMGQLQNSQSTSKLKYNNGTYELQYCEKRSWSQYNDSIIDSQCNKRICNQSTKETTAHLEQQNESYESGKSLVKGGTRTIMPQFTTDIDLPLHGETVLLEFDKRNSQLFQQNRKIVDPQCGIEMDQLQYAMLHLQCNRSEAQSVQDNTASLPTTCIKETEVSLDDNMCDIKSQNDEKVRQQFGSFKRQCDNKQKISKVQSNIKIQLNDNKNVLVQNETTVQSHYSEDSQKSLYCAEMSQLESNKEIFLSHGMQHTQEIDKSHLDEKPHQLESVIEEIPYLEKGTSTRLTQEMSVSQQSTGIQNSEHKKDCLQLLWSNKNHQTSYGDEPAQSLVNKEIHQQCNNENSQDSERILLLVDECSNNAAENKHTEAQIPCYDEIHGTLDNEQISQATSDVKTHIHYKKHSNTVQPPNLQSQSETTEVHSKPVKESVMNRSKTEEKCGDPLLNTNLEPLGDIHLELFSDESIFEESQREGKFQALQELVGDHQQNTKNGNLIYPEKETTSNSRIAVKSKDDIIQSSTLQDDNKIIQQTKNINTTDEYETANSNSSLLASPQQNITSECEVPSSSEDFVLTKENTKQLKLGASENGNNNDRILKRIPKRKRLGYISTISKKKTFNVIENLEECQTSQGQQKINKENSPVTFESHLENLPEQLDMSSELFCTPSNFSDSIQKISTTSSSNEQNTKKRRRSLKAKLPKFNPPKQLTKKEIELNYLEQNKRMLESENSSQYLAQIINRPSARQLRQASHVASFRKTSAGVIVIPAKPNAKSRKKKFVAPLKQNSQNFDMTLFSDKNSGKFELFMNSTNKNVTTNAKQCASSYEIVSSPVVRKQDNNKNCSDSNENSQASPFRIFGNNIYNLKNECLKESQGPSTSNVTKNISQTSESVDQSNKGYYTQNKTCIDNIVNKYLNPGNISSATTVCSSSQKKTSPMEKSFNSQFLSWES